MIEMSFIRGGGLRKVVVKGKSVTYLLAELGFKPYTINLDKLREHEGIMKEMNLDDKDRKEIKRLSKFGTEKEIAQDIKRDLQKEGWRLTKWS